MMGRQGGMWGHTVAFSYDSVSFSLYFFSCFGELVSLRTHLASLDGQ